MLYSCEAMRAAVGKHVSIVALIALAGFTLSWSVEVLPFSDIASPQGKNGEEHGHKGLGESVLESQPIPCLHQVTCLVPATAGGVELPLAGFVGDVFTHFEAGLSHLPEVDFPARAPPVAARRDVTVDLHGCTCSQARIPTDPLKHSFRST
ncbi:MAG TPA: hypothetical protein P5568_08685 [Acidobacteriota bacterium]|nr:hypothetical protein [Acidobacteriota bacterium]HRV08531.1 hypothetical protein [Acidobacteriota bacterium]